MNLLRTLSVSLFAVIAGAPSIAAAADMPVAVRWWGQGCVSIETYWDLDIVIDPYSLDVGYGDPNLSADLVLITHEHGDHNNAGLVSGDPTVVHGLGEDGKVQEIHHRLDRLANENEVTWKPADSEEGSGHSVTVTSIPAFHDTKQGAERGAVSMWLIEVDGVRILHCGDLGQTELTAKQREQIGKLDLLLIPVGGVYTVDGPQAAAIVKSLAPRIVVPIHYKTDALKIPLQPVDGFVAAVGDGAEVDRPVSNTVAVSAAGDGAADSSLRLVIPKYEAWAPSGEFAELLEKMDTSAEAAAEVFRPLSAKQMSFQPSDGTHTPRWNAEHMMATELMFFTQIYSNLDPELAPIRLNPKQMPPDYQAAHPDWNGAEEARQIERVSSLVRRFAYLLEGVPLEEPAPGGGWTPKRLMQQMDRHYGEHSGNVEKKFDDPAWPEA